MARYLLDSHIFLWAKRKAPELGGRALTEIEKAENTLFVSLASLWELAAKAATGRLPEFATIMGHGPSALDKALSESNFQLLPVDLRHIRSLYQLAPHHGDPFDRMLITQAMLEDLTLITSDRSFQFYPGLSLLKA